MIDASHLRSHRSPHIATLQRLLEQSDGEQTPETLVTLCTDPRLDQHVLPRLYGQDTLLLREAGPRFHDGRSETPLWEGIRYAIEELRIRTLVVCGHSYAVQPVDPVADRRDPPQSGSNLVYRMAAVERSVSQARTQLAQQLDWLLRRDAVSGRIARGELDVLGLFYVFASGMFLAYDVDRLCFRPVTASAPDV